MTGSATHNSVTAVAAAQQWSPETVGALAYAFLTERPESEPVRGAFLRFVDEAQQVDNEETANVAQAPQDEAPAIDAPTPRVTADSFLDTLRDRIAAYRRAIKNPDGEYLPDIAAEVVDAAAALDKILVAEVSLPRAWQPNAPAEVKRLRHERDDYQIALGNAVSALNLALECADRGQFPADALDSCRRTLARSSETFWSLVHVAGDADRPGTTRCQPDPSPAGTA